MSPDEARQLIEAVLHEIAPEADVAEVGPDETLQEGLDLDSIDFLNFVVALHERTGLEIPERDYPRLSTLQGGIEYLVAGVPAAG